MFVCDLGSLVPFEMLRTLCAERSLVLLVFFSVVKKSNKTGDFCFPYLGWLDSVDLVRYVIFTIAFNLVSIKANECVIVIYAVKAVAFFQKMLENKFLAKL